MAENMETILSPWETEAFIEHFQALPLEEFGTKRWFEHHKVLMLLNQQSVLEISSMREESVKELFITFQKIPVLIYEAIQIEIWKHKVFPMLIEINEEPSNTFILFSVFYHEELAVSLLENVLYHSETIETIDDCILDLIDYAINNITHLLFGKKQELEINDRTSSCLQELLEKWSELEFDIGIKCISILRYLSEFANNLPLCALSRMLCTHDLPYLLCQLIESKPWTKLINGEKFCYDGKWEKVNFSEEDKICKTEGQVWFGLREILLNPNCAPYYEITEFRLSQFLKLQKFLHEHVLDQIPPLLDLRKWLSYLNVTSQASNAQRPINVEMIPEIRSTIMDKHNKKWKKLAKNQSKTLFTKNIDEIKATAQILSESYDMNKLDIVDGKKCFLCKNTAKKRCSKCKEAWYCDRECQVKDWNNHKDFCTKIEQFKETND
ncbi:zinc finger MYND domain-containing protein 10 [Leptopilina boulardi]|uniref:zinc finger MYND domain-containing protein 10 n=1 Tax=Leptopilina boulardi TaxID=63433 RepID=UPI0021F53B53|nr:zinc finger MYND domain-containing protein 10 [Leptopilina boulardi]